MHFRVPCLAGKIIIFPSETFSLQFPMPKKRRYIPQMFPRIDSRVIICSILDHLTENKSLLHTRKQLSATHIDILREEKSIKIRGIEYLLSAVVSICRYSDARYFTFWEKFEVFTWIVGDWITKIKDCIKANKRKETDIYNDVRKINYQKINVHRSVINFREGNKIVSEIFFDLKFSSETLIFHC